MAMLYVRAKFSRSVADTDAAGAVVGATPRTFRAIDVGCTVGGAGATAMTSGVDVVVLWPSLTATVAEYDPWFWKECDTVAPVAVDPSPNVHA